MQLNQPVDRIIEQIHQLDRDGCVAELRGIQTPRLDFSDEYLASMSLDQLRHVLMAACLQARRAPGHRRAS